MKNSPRQTARNKSTIRTSNRAGYKALVSERGSADGRKKSEVRRPESDKEAQDADLLMYRAWKKTYENAQKGKRVG